MKPSRLVVSLILLAVAVLLRFWVAPLLERLQGSYASEVTLSEQDQFRDSPAGEWLPSTLSTQRVDQTVTVSGDISIIEGALHVYNASGGLNFETTSLYAVDQRTRLNIAGYGQVDRTGQYLFPLHVQQIEYEIWDPYYIGLRQANFERTEQLNELQVYVFSFTGTKMDETTGYDYLADVHENYLAYTDGKGTIWVEPLSGIAVDYVDSGVSYFVDPVSGNRVADFNKWTERYTPETRAAQLALARLARRHVLALEIWLPGGALLLAILWLVYGLHVPVKAVG